MTEGGLTKAALVEAVAHIADLTKKDAETIVDTMFGSIVEALRRGECRTPRLRQLSSPAREPHRGRNPRTGDRVDVPSQRVAYIRPGKELKELINREPAQAGPAAYSFSGVDIRCRGRRSSPSRKFQRAI